MEKKQTASGYRLIFGYLGLFLIIIGIIILLPLLIIPFLPLLGQSGFEDAIWWPAFVIPAVGSIALGCVLFFSLVYKKEKARLGKHQDSLLLVLIWLAAIFISLVPFVLRNFNFVTREYHQEISFISALFETASGYCSIGLTVFNKTMLDPSWSGYYIYVLYRSILMFFGGVGLVLVVSSAISDRYGINLYQAEGHNDKLMPNLGRSAKLILGIYVAYILIGTGAYVLAGMSVFDAINHSISAISTGGFTPHAESIYYYTINDGTNVGGFWNCSAIAIELISIILMLLGSTNFITHYRLFKLRFGKAFNDSEVKFVLILSAVMLPIVTLSTFLHGNVVTGSGATSILEGLWDSFRYAGFHFVSCLTTTGFSNSPGAFSDALTLFGTTTIAIYILVMFIGGGTGSTSGAAKQQRVVLSLKGMYWNIKKRLSPPQMVMSRHIHRHGDDMIVRDDDIHEANSMILIYFLVLFVGTISLSLVTNFYPYECMFEFMSALSSTGLSMSSFNLAAVNPTAKESASMAILSFSMLLGRLEILPFFFGGYRLIRDIFQKETV